MAAKYLGFFLGPAADLHAWDGPLLKWEARVRAIAAAAARTTLAEAADRLPGTRLAAVQIGRAMRSLRGCIAKVAHSRPPSGGAPQVILLPGGEDTHIIPVSTGVPQPRLDASSR